MRIGVPRESRPGETRVAATPKTVEQIRALGYAVFVESGAGDASSFDDAAYVRAGADVIDDAVWNADVLLKINAPSEAEIARLRHGQVVVSLVAPEPVLGHFMVFMLSVVIGFYVIGNVHHALHTPLMSVTNAISGIIIVGALLQVGHDSIAVSVLAFIGILVASINVFGGFRVTARMLEMFRREEVAR